LPVIRSAPDLNVNIEILGSEYQLAGRRYNSAGIGHRAVAKGVENDSSFDTRMAGFLFIALREKFHHCIEYLCGGAFQMRPPQIGSQLAPLVDNFYAVPANSEVFLPKSLFVLRQSSFDEVEGYIRTQVHIGSFLSLWKRKSLRYRFFLSSFGVRADPFKSDSKSMKKYLKVKKNITDSPQAGNVCCRSPCGTIFSPALSSAFPDNVRV